MQSSKCKLSEKLRSRMVDWVIEVFYNYKDSVCEYTYFRAIEIMDYFIKCYT